MKNRMSRIIFIYIFAQFLSKNKRNLNILNILFHRDTKLYIKKKEKINIKN